MHSPCWGHAFQPWGCYRSPATSELFFLCVYSWFFATWCMSVKKEHKLCQCWFPRFLVPAEPVPPLWPPQTPRSAAAMQPPVLPGLPHAACPAHTSALVPLLVVPGRHFLPQKARDCHIHHTHSWDSAGNAAAITEFIIAFSLENKHLVLLATFPFSRLTRMVTAKPPATNSAPSRRAQGTAMGPILSAGCLRIRRDAAEQSPEGTRLFQTRGEPAIHHG